ncbi:MAG: hypothetical protein LBS88_13115 [Tannerellaceae bacterium]|jgi:hypothetical protein|nr:hypothetical protein [Tannerellaceae bacterium]
MKKLISISAIILFVTAGCGGGQQSTDDFITDALNSKLFSSVDGDILYPIGLVRGELGLCIYYYYLSRWEDRKEFKQIAEKLPDDVVSKLSNSMDVTVETGLAGIFFHYAQYTGNKMAIAMVNEKSRTLRQ